MRYLLDADWIIHLLAGRKDLADRIQLLAPEDIAICLVTVAEVYEEAFTYANLEAHLHAFRQFVSNFQLLNLTLPIIERFAEIRAYLRRRVYSKYRGICVQPDGGTTAYQLQE